MTIKIGEKIKQLRKKANVNQEKFAEYLGITPQAVSKWEVEDCYPDIELLPSIANFFSISIDELMCFDTINNQKKIDMIIEQMGPDRHKNWLNGTKTEMLRNAIQEFPNNYDLLYCLARTLCFSKEPYLFLSKEKRRGNLRESILICNRILSDCTKDTLRFRSLQVLAHAYHEIGEKEKAIETANNLPFARDSRDMILPEILDGEIKSKQIVQNIWLLSDMFEYLIQNLANSKYKNDAKKRIQLFNKIISIEEILHENNDFIYENLRLRAFYYWIAEEYMKLEDFSHAFDCIEKFAEYSIRFDSLPEVATYTSVIYYGESCPKNKDFDYKNTTLEAKNFLISKEIFKPLHENTRFKAIIDKLEEKENQL